MIPEVVRNSLPGLYQAPLALLSIAKDAVSGEFTISEATAAPVNFNGLVFAARRPG